MVHVRTSSRRAGRRNRSTAETIPAVTPVSPGMVGGRYKPLTDSEVLRIHELVLQLMSGLACRK